MLEQGAQEGAMAVDICAEGCMHGCGVSKRDDDEEKNQDQNVVGRLRYLIHKNTHVNSLKSNSLKQQNRQQQWLWLTR
jgi:hypothetical protein